MKYIAALLITLFLASPALAEDALTITMGAQKQRMTAAALLKNPQARDVTIPNDPSYKKNMTYPAIPLTALLAGMKLPPDAVIEAVATDGFVAQLPLDLVLHTAAGASEAFVAIEPPDAKWPNLAGKKASAGPFYIVWLNPAASGIRSEQWPYMVAQLRAADSPAKRWKELAVDKDLPADSPIRAGQALTVTQCMACHKLNGAGSSDVGPDLNRPMSPTAYFTPDALKKYIRDPASLRKWDAMQMPSFSKDALSDREIDLIIAYLQHKASQERKP
ncbi:MAG: cytochrome c [Alphaproteobacteria bacterium]|nr:cytochrome c [Alphaproteobacteria bacterium]